MRKALSLAVLSGIAVVLVSGCHSGHGKVAGTEASLSANPVVQHDVAIEKGKINNCLAHGTILTKAGRKAFFTCASGGMTPAAFETCATGQLKSTSLLTKAGREAWLTAVGQKCVVTK